MLTATQTHNRCFNKDITKYLDNSQNKSNKKYTKSPGTSTRKRACTTMTSTKHLASTVHMLFPNSPHPSSVQLNCSAHSPRTACIQNCSDLTYTTHMQQPHPPSRTFTLLQAGSKQLQRCAYAAHCGTGLFCPRQLLHSSCTSSKAACSSHAAKR